MKLFTLVALLMFLFVLNLYIMKESSTSIKALLPVLFGFFIMGFCDVVGIATSYVKADFGLSETIAGFLPSMVFVTGGPGGYFYEPYRSEENGIGEYVGDYCGNDYSFY